MKKILKDIYPWSCDVSEKDCHRERKNDLAGFPKVALMVIMMSLTLPGLQAQSGGWDGSSTNGTTGYTDHGNGVIQLLDVNAAGCASAAVHETSATYDPGSGAAFNKCYQVFFGCPGNDDIASDQKGDGMAFSFWKNSATYNINNGLACGGGLGYMGSASDSKMITIEFDTWSSQGNTGFDAAYGGGTSGNNDEVALHRDGIANDGGRITASNAGNLEDGLEHTVCISYDPATDVLSVTIDGNTVFSYDATGTGYELENYFGAGALNQTWSSGKFGATNPATVSNGADISDNVGGPLCPAGVIITSPSSGDSFGGCPVGSIAITATATPPAGNTVSYVEFFVDGVSIGTDNTANYGIAWNSPTDGNHAITAVAHYIPSGTNSASSAVSINVGGISLASTPPVIDGTAEALWSSYTTLNLNQASGGVSAPDLDATYKITYDATYLYLLVDVTDDDLRNESANSWEDDGVEIFIDIGNDKSGTYQANDFQYSFDWNSAAIIENKHGATAGVTFAQTNRVGGYTMEIRIPWTTLGAGAPAAGTYIGFDVKINDDDGGGGRDHELSWNDGTFGAWNNPSLFGTHEFLSCDPLPVRMLTFTGKVINETVVLNWATTEEINNDKFIIERSAGLINWQAIGEVAGAGNFTSIINYSFIDRTPLDGISYYRLRQVDVDGGFANSNVVAVQTDMHTISITPNPFGDALTIKSNIDGDVDISIQDALGRLLYHANVESENGMLRIQPDLSSGTYVITIQTETFIEQQKIIKK